MTVPEIILGIHLVFMALVLGLIIQGSIVQYEERRSPASSAPHYYDLPRTSGSVRRCGSSGGHQFSCQTAAEGRISPYFLRVWNLIPTSGLARCYTWRVRYRNELQAKLEELSS